MKSTGVLLYPLFSEYELSVALSVLKQGGHPITTIGIMPGPIKGESDLTCLPDTTLDEADCSTLDSLLLPGCMDIRTLMGKPEIPDFIRRCTENREILVAAISSSPYLLALAGLLTNRRYTVGIAAEERKALGVFEETNYCHDPVVEDGNLITARGRGFIEFGITLGRKLSLEFDPEWYRS